jgi:zinc transporter ZupT
MLGACFGLIAEGTQHGGWQTIVGLNLGILFILVVQRILARHEIQFGSLQYGGSRRIILMLVVMTVHSFAEGVAVGAAFGGGMTLAALVTVAIAVHNVPEGLAISAVLRPRGMSLVQCAGWSVFSSLPQPLMAVPAYVFVDTFAPGLPFGIGFAAGAMVLMVFLELLPEAYHQERRPRVALLVSATFVAMILFQKVL